MSQSKDRDNIIFYNSTHEILTDRFINLVNGGNMCGTYVVNLFDATVNNGNFKIKKC